MATRNRTAFVLKQLFSAYPNTQVEEGTVAIYIRLLGDIPVEELQAVVDQCIADCKFLPTVAEVREHWRNLTRNLGELSGAEGWGLVQAEIRRMGSWGSPHFENAKVQRVVDMMGWLNICQSENLAVDRAQFMRIFDTLADREDRIGKLLPQARALAAERGLVPIVDSLRMLGERRRTPSPEIVEEDEVQS
jgi:hypothetical protein